MGGGAGSLVSSPGLSVPSLTIPPPMHLNDYVTRSIRECGKELFIRRMNSLSDFTAVMTFCTPNILSQEAPHPLTLLVVTAQSQLLKSGVATFCFFISSSLSCPLGLHQEEPSLVASSKPSQALGIT